MNCQGCDRTIDYRFQTNCSSCETEHVEPLAIDRMQEPVGSETHPTWTRRVINLIYLLISSMAGMISGGVVLYFAAAITYAVLPRSNHAYRNCAEADAILAWFVVTGAFLGTVGGSAFAVKKPLCK